MLTLPAWDCLPYDRASPALRVMAERLATLQALQVPRKAPQLLIVDRQCRDPARADPVPHPRSSPGGWPRASGSSATRWSTCSSPTATSAPTRSTTPANSRCAGRSSTSIPAGEATALRLDFFGDEIETMRRFDPADQRSTGAAGAFTLMPASEALLDEDSIKRFRARYRETVRRQCHRRPALPGGQRRPAAGGDGALAAACSRTSSRPCSTISATHDVIVRDGGTDGALDSRAEAIQDYFTNRERAMVAEPGSYRPLAPSALYLAKKEWQGGDRRAADPPRLDLPRAGQRQGHRLRASTARATSPPSARRTPMSTKRSSSTSPSCGKTRRKSSSPATSTGARERLAGLLDDHGLSSAQAGRQLAGGARREDRRGADRAAARPWLHRARRRGADRAGHARRPPRPAQEAPQERRRLPRRAGRADARATSSSTPTMASPATRG